MGQFLNDIANMSPIGDAIGKVIETLSPFRPDFFNHRGSLNKIMQEEPHSYDFLTYQNDY